MAFKKSFFSLKHSSDLHFSWSLRVLFVVALLQLVSAILFLAPRWVRSGASLLAKENTSQSEPSITSTEAAIVHGSGEISKAKEPIESEITSPSSSSEAFSKAAATLQEYTRDKAAKNGDTGTLRGAYLGIINVEESVTPEESHRLKIAIKSNSVEPIEVSQVKVEVYFYDQLDDKIVPSESQVASRWITTPVNWKREEPELLEVTCLAKNQESKATYLGYIIAIYYQGDLQGYSANPATITNQFPIKVYIGETHL